MSELAGTGRHLSSDELRLWTSFLDASRIIETELSNHLTKEHGMTHREYEVLVRVDGAGGSMRMVTLATQIEASRALTSQTVDRLLERGWIERRPSPDDGRGVDAVLTTAGRKALAEAAEPHAALVRQLLLQRVDDIAGVGGELGRMADHLRGHRRGERCDDTDCPLSN